MRLCKLAAAATVLITSTSANAALIDRGNGLIYDSTQDITWMADANYAKTSGYHASGMMDWFEATTWADRLNYGGYDDWRLSSTLGTDYYDRCSGTIECSDPGNEMAHLFYNDFGIADGDSIWDAPSGSSRNLFENYSSFGIGEHTYWTDTKFEYGNDPHADHFDTGYGFLGFSNAETSERFAWAVRDGDVSAVPVPAAVWLFGSGLVGLIGVARRKKA